jgi:Holliday junction resolvase RusA-like endonuclease
MTIDLTVYGIPGPQGSKKAVGRRKNGSTILVESSAKVKPWRAAVVEAALAKYAGTEPLTGPLVLRVNFTLPQPVRLPKGRTTPCVYPDLSKLVRSTEDALTTAHIWLDDAQVVSTMASKSYPDPKGLSALHLPGARISICRLGEWFEEHEYVEKVA